MQVKFNDHGKNPPHAEVVRDVKTVKELRSGLDELHYGGGGDIDEQAFAGETSSMQCCSFSRDRSCLGHDA